MGGSAAARGWLDRAARLALRCLAEDPGAEPLARELLDRAAQDLPANPVASVSELALALRHYAVLQHLVGSGEGHEADAALAERVRVAAAATDDAGLWACWASVADPQRHAEHLARVVMDDRTVALFEVSEGGHRVAAAYQLERGAWRRAALVHRAWGEQTEAADIHAANGEASAACRLYRSGGDHGKALACATQAGDEVEMALACEGLGELRRALDLWSSLGRGQDAARVRELIRKASG